MWLPHLGNRTSGQKSGEALPDGHEALALEDAQDLTGPQASQAPVKEESSTGQMAQLDYQDVA